MEPSSEHGCRRILPSILAVAIVSLALAAFLAWKGFHNLTAWMAVLTIGGFGSASLLTGIYGGGTTVTPFYGAARWLIWLVAVAGQLGLAVTLPSYRPTGWRLWVMLVGFAAVAFGFIGPIVVLFGGSRTELQPWTRGDALIYDFAQPVVVAILAFQYFRLAKGALRDQFFFALLPFVSWLALSGLSLVDTPSIPIFGFAGYAQVATLGLFMLMLAVNLLGRRETRFQDSILLAWCVISLLIVPINAAMSATIYYVTAFNLVLLFYAIGRYQILRIDFRLPTITGRSLKAAVVLPVFFIVLQTVELLTENLAAVSYGVSIVAGGLAFFGLSYVQNWLTRSTGAPKAASASLASYEAYRRVEIYRGALEAAIADGEVEPREFKTLAALRDSLGITMDEHNALERDARQENVKRVVSLG